MAKVFISYSRRDYLGDDGIVIADNIIDKIITALADHDISYWMDREGIHPGYTYAESIAQSIKECDIFLFVSTKSANSSPWTLREISTAIDFGKTIIPIKADHSPYADSVALYLASVQHIDWKVLGEEEAIKCLVSRITGNDDDQSKRAFDAPQMSFATRIFLLAGTVFLTGVYATLTFQFLWAKTLISSEIMGGLVGYLCEFGVLLSIYYLIRMLRLRRCTFALPALTVLIVFLSGLLVRDKPVVYSSVLLLIGWLLVFLFCLLPGKNKKNFFKSMSRTFSFLTWTDPENLILVYLLLKAVIIVVAHYTNFTLDHVFLWDVIELV